MNINKISRRIARHFRKTYKNKLCAIALLICGYIPVLLEQDATALVIIAMFAVPMFFARKNLIS